MRSVAPESPGAAASQNNSFGVNLKPSSGRFTATTLHSCHTANARNSAGIEIHRLMLAIARPSRCQNSLSSGVQTVRTRPSLRLVDTVSVDMANPFCKPRYARCAAIAGAPASAARCGTISVQYIQISDTSVMPHISMKMVLLTPVMSTSAPNMIGSRKPPSAPTSPTMPETTPILSEYSSEMYLNTEALPIAHATPIPNISTVKAQTLRPTCML